MKITQFRDEACRTAKRLGIAEANIGRTVEVLSRLLQTDDIEVSEWSVRKGKGLVINSIFQSREMVVVKTTGTPYGCS